MNVQELEKQYLDAKIAYYEGRPIISDPEFDFIERLLRESGSKVVEQVGSKRKDFDYPHPTPMLSLSKIQMEPDNIMEAEFLTWYRKRREAILSSDLPVTTVIRMGSSAKYDGNAIDIVYKNGSVLYQVLTRGDGRAGKNITDRMKLILPERLDMPMEEGDVLEIRCEVVIERAVFEEKYAEDFANPRNFVAGILGGDDFIEEVIGDLTVVPLHYILNGEHIGPTALVNCFRKHPNVHMFEEVYFFPEEYPTMIETWVKMRDSNPFQLDGIVLSFEPEYRSLLGENSHDPEWAVAIKFVPEEAVTEYMGIEYTVSKTGELAPVVLLQPTKLAGTVVKRASGYNAGFIISKRIGPGAVFNIVKAGDIIPEIKNVLVESETGVDLPLNCPSCSSSLEFDGIHLTCPNQKCPGRVAKILSTALKTIGIKGTGGKTIAPFARSFYNIIDVIEYVRKKGREFDIAEYGFAVGGRAHDKFVTSFENIKSVSMSKIIQSMGYPNVGKKLSEQVANEMCGVECNYTGLERALVAFMQTDKVKNEILSAVAKLEAVGIKVDKPIVIDSSNLIFVCMTGSPASAGFATKGEFLSSYGGRLVEVSVTDKRCNYLVTNDLNSKTSKMQNAMKKGVKIVTYDHPF
jgi:DNA ligase (NAD+)